jgi:hypothetical protein
MGINTVLVKSIRKIPESEIKLIRFREPEAVQELEISASE